MFTSESEYIENMLRIADILIAKYDKVIFATTTPVTIQNQYNKNSDIEKYNALIVPLLKEKGINPTTPVIICGDADEYLLDTQLGDVYAGTSNVISVIGKSEPVVEDKKLEETVTEEKAVAIPKKKGINYYVKILFQI